MPKSDPANPKDKIAQAKIDISLLPAAGIIHGAHAMRDGDIKYNAYNWRSKKVKSRVYISAAMRHLLSFLDGEDCAEDSGVHHLGHSIACCAIILDAQETGNLVDDRPVPGTASKILARLNKLVAERSAAGLDPVKVSKEPALTIVDFLAAGTTPDKALTKVPVHLRRKNVAKARAAATRVVRRKRKSRIKKMLTKYGF